MVCGACGPGQAPPAFYLDISDLYGPTVNVTLNGQVVGTLMCGGDVRLAPGTALPALPWDVSIVEQTGTTIWRSHETGTNGWRHLTTLGDDVDMQDWTMPTPAGFLPGTCPP